MAIKRTLPQATMPSTKKAKGNINLLALVKKANSKVGDRFTKFVAPMNVSIGICGATSTGKTALISALLKCKGLPSAAGVCTGYNMKITTVEKTELTPLYKLRLPNGETSTFADAKALEDTLRWSFADTIEKNKSPNFSLTGHLEIAQDVESYIDLIDTPGPSVGTQTGIWSQCIAGLGGSKTPTLLLTVRYQAVLGEEIASNYICMNRDMFRSVNLILVITHMDVMADAINNADDVTKNRIITSFMRDLSNFTEMLGVIKHVAFVCTDSRKESFSEQRTHEMEVLSTLQECIKIDGASWGVDALREIIETNYIANYCGQNVEEAKTNITVEINKLKEVLRAKTSTLDPSSYTAPLTVRLMQLKTLKETVGIKIRESIKTDMLALLDKRIIIKPQASKKSAWMPFLMFGNSSLDCKVQEQEESFRVAALIGSDYVKNIGRLVDIACAEYKTFAAQAIEEIVHHDRLKNTINARVSSFLGEKKSEIVAYLSRWTSNAASNSDMRLESFADSRWLFENLDQKKASTAPTVVAVIAALVTNLFYTADCTFNNDIFLNFPNGLTSIFATLPDNWQRESAGEIDHLKYDLTNLQGLYDAIDSISRSISS